MSEPVRIYTFRDSHFAPSVDTVVSVAPLEVVVKVYGGGGVKDADGLFAVFGGAAYFRDDATEKDYLGVWGARKAAKFRNAVRQSVGNIEMTKSPPPGRLAWHLTK